MRTAEKLPQDHLDAEQTRTYTEFVRLIALLANKLATSADIQDRNSYVLNLTGHQSTQEVIESVDGREFFIGALSHLAYSYLHNMVTAISAEKLNGEELEAAVIKIMRLLLTLSIGTVGSDDVVIKSHILQIVESLHELYSKNQLHVVTLDEAKHVILGPVIAGLQERRSRK